MINEIAAFIASKAGLLIGAGLFEGWRPQDAPDACDTVLESSGGQAFFDLPARVDLNIQVMSRAADYDDARARAWAVFLAIGKTTAWTFGPLGSGQPAYQGTIDPIAPPQWIGQDDKGRHEFSTNYVFRLVRNS